MDPHQTPLHWGYSTATHHHHHAAPPPPPPPHSHNNPWAQPQSNVLPTPTQSSVRKLKRAISESDCEDLYSEESSKEQWVTAVYHNKYVYVHKLYPSRNWIEIWWWLNTVIINTVPFSNLLPIRTSPGESDSCQMMSRKKRRGVIEKKRRDRINCSLHELKRLVPSAYEKQGSAKLEKAEILQLTVDHLKALHVKGRQRSVKWCGWERSGNGFGIIYMSGGDGFYDAIKSDNRYEVIFWV